MAISKEAVKVAVVFFAAMSVECWPRTQFVFVFLTLIHGSRLGLCVLVVLHTDRNTNTNTNTHSTSTGTSTYRIGGPKPGTCVVDDELVVVGGVLIPGVRFEVSVQVAYSSVFVLHSDISALLA